MCGGSLKGGWPLAQRAFLVVAAVVAAAGGGGCCCCCCCCCCCWCWCWCWCCCCCCWCWWWCWCWRCCCCCCCWWWWWWWWLLLSFCTLRHSSLKDCRRTTAFGPPRAHELAHRARAHKPNPTQPRANGELTPERTVVILLVGDCTSASSISRRQRLLTLTATHFKIVWMHVDSRQPLMLGLGTGVIDSLLFRFLPFSFVFFLFSPFSCVFCFAFKESRRKSPVFSVLAIVSITAQRRLLSTVTPVALASLAASGGVDSTQKKWARTIAQLLLLRRSPPLLL